MRPAGQTGNPAPLLRMVDGKERATVAETVEPDHISRARRILDEWVLNPNNRQGFIQNDQIIALLRAKHKSLLSAGGDFSRLMLAAAVVRDETTRSGGEPAVASRFASLVSYLECFDTVAGAVNSLAFFPGSAVTAATLEGLIGGKGVFEALQEGLFTELFIAGPSASRFLDSFGRRKLELLATGLAAQTDRQELLGELRRLAEEERLYLKILAELRPAIRENFARYADRERQETLRRLVTIDLRQRQELAGEMPEELFARALSQVKQETVYLHNLLPAILAGGEPHLREEFLAASSLDRSTLEEVEREFCRANGLGTERLEALWRG